MVVQWHCPRSRRRPHDAHRSACLTLTAPLALAILTISHPAARVETAGNACARVRCITAEGWRHKARISSVRAPIRCAFSAFGAEFLNTVHRRNTPVGDGVEERAVILLVEIGVGA